MFIYDCQNLVMWQNFCCQLIMVAVTSLNVKKSTQIHLFQRAQNIAKYLVLLEAYGIVLLDRSVHLAKMGVFFYFWQGEGLKFIATTIFLVLTTQKSNSGSAILRKASQESSRFLKFTGKLLPILTYVVEENGFYLQDKFHVFLMDFVQVKG